MGALCQNPIIKWYDASIYGNVDIICKYLTQCVGNVDQENQVFTALMTAISYHNIDVVMLLLEYELSYVTSRSLYFSGYTYNYIETKMILSGGSSAMHFAVVNQNLDCLVRMAMRISENDQLHRFSSVTDDLDFTALELGTALNWNLLPIAIQAAPHYFLYMEAQVEKKTFNWLSVSIDFGNLQMLKFILSIYSNEPELIKSAMIQCSKGEVENSAKLLPQIKVDKNKVAECKSYLKYYLNQTHEPRQSWIRDYTLGVEYDTYTGFEELKTERERVQEIQEAKRKYIIENRKIPIEQINMENNMYLQAVYSKYNKLQDKTNHIDIPLLNKSITKNKIEENQADLKLPRNQDSIANIGATKLQMNSSISNIDINQNIKEKLEESSQSIENIMHTDVEITKEMHHENNEEEYEYYESTDEYYEDYEEENEEED
ncbi:Ankyrin_repeats-containing protein [Hexamita inflata]|uniref:Ankyrin repeats-containing protein n=1 Tax=Hexamita inflata TaxID=28002 RepID=A0AA86QUL9_9EUKA|nr:Ankyrin repeats-containing protein [Hexamita inflata]